ncbi:hypothetical protein C7974DRAFT_427389 [Boeremia exigua]|uniref:uncharacterized protein n=1 Tax=Boeremia exigua TaxID=749465 RepID=UPI001E8D8BF4|nr:uncharacterized protein C7974DRAFT_427389 [Boeremia exigua]KAH6616400.1 hypothetical protein C7974DRAFT_427389 [Boeremia exigua]
MSAPTPPKQPNISVREYIYFLPHPLPPGTPVPYTPGLPAANVLNLPPHGFEPTQTLVLTSPRGVFVDARYWRDFGPGGPARGGLEWAFAGRASAVEVDEGHEIYGAYTHATWRHWVDSRFKLPVGARAGSGAGSSATASMVDTDEGASTNASSETDSTAPSDMVSPATSPGIEFAAPAVPPPADTDSLADGASDADPDVDAGPRFPVDEGLMFTLGDGLFLEHGHAFHPSLGRVAGHEELWRSVEVLSTEVLAPGEEATSADEAAESKKEQAKKEETKKDKRERAKADKKALKKQSKAAKHSTTSSSSPTSTSNDTDPSDTSPSQPSPDREVRTGPPKGRKVSVVLRTSDPANGIRGVIVRVGQYVQGIVVVGGKVATERWEYMPPSASTSATSTTTSTSTSTATSTSTSAFASTSTATASHPTKGKAKQSATKATKAGWTRTHRSGTWFLPCAAAWREEALLLGGRVRFEGFEWVVEEVWGWE